MSFADNRTWAKGWLAAITVGLVALGVRLPGVGDFMTVDEQNWMVRTGDFMKSLRRGDIEGTFQGTHPGATAMWIMGSGITLQEWRLGVDLNSDNLILFRKAAILPVLIVTALLVAAVTGFLVLLVGRPAAALGGLLLAVEPYLVGMSQIAHLDGLQALLMLAALVSWAVYLKICQRWFVYLTGILLGLAMGTKLLLALWLLPSFAGMIFMTAWSKADASVFWPSGRRLVGVIVISLIVFVLVWPAVITKADFQLGYISRDTATIITDEHGAYETADNPIDMRTFYLRTLLGRLTPQVQILLVASSWYLVAHRKRRDYQLPATNYQLLVILLLYALGYLAMITLAAKKADRYALPALAVAPLVAGIVAAWAGQIVARRWHWSKRMRTIVGGVLFLAVVALPLLWSPYAIAYNNPLWPNIRPLTQQGWGEGLEEAAAWLNERPRSDQMYIASWYPSVMRTYFSGMALGLSSRHDYRVQYIVAYRNMGGRAGDDQASDVLDELRGREPVHTVFIRGVPYAWIYETGSVGNFFRTIGEITSEREVGQTVRPEDTQWSSLDIGFATFSNRANMEDVVLHIRSSPSTAEDLRVARVNARDLRDNQWHRFEFEPIDGAAGREFYILVTSPTSVPGNAVTVRYTDLDIRPGQMYVNGEPKEGDIAYRL